MTGTSDADTIRDFKRCNERLLAKYDEVFTELEELKRGPESQDEEQLRDALLAELRCELVLSKINTLKIERLGIALKHRLISVRQCLARQIADDPAAFHDMEGSA